MAEDEKKEEPIMPPKMPPITPEDPWRGLMADVGLMMRAALEEAQDIAEEHKSNTGDAAGTDSIIRLAVAIFDATAAANATKRLIEAQQGVRRGGLIAIGKDGRPVTM